MRSRWPLVLGLAVALFYTVWRLSLVSWNAAGLAQIGTQYSEGVASGSEGYDGQFAYYIALIPDPNVVDVYLDVPAYRYQRILLPGLRLAAGPGPGGACWLGSADSQLAGLCLGSVGCDGRPPGCG